MSFISEVRALSFEKNKIFYKSGFISFQLGLLLLASAPVISIIFLIYSSIIASINRKDNFFLDKYNYPFLIASLLMVINCIFISLNDNNLYPNLNVNSWIGLSNWLPLFWCFWSFQKYLRNQELRLKTARLLIVGTIPVLISCFSQYFLKIYGPYKFFNSLVIWYQRPLGSENGVTGLFNNQNYAGAWLCIILPFCLFFLIRENKNTLIRFCFFIFSLTVAYTIVLTTSRNAILSIFLTILLFTKSIKTKILTSIALISIPFLLNLVPLISVNLANFINRYIPFELVKKTSLSNLSNFDLYPRFEIWDKAIALIKSNILLGHGAGSFGSIYTISGGNFKGIQHSHNIFLELAFSHGLLTGLIIFLMMIYLIFYSWKSNLDRVNIDAKTTKNRYYFFDKAWIISFIIFFFIHISDITYFDGRISILCWLLLAGMTSILKENKNIKNT